MCVLMAAPAGECATSSETTRFKLKKWFLLCHQMWPFSLAASLFYKLIKIHSLNLFRGANGRHRTLLTGERRAEQLTAVRSSGRGVGGGR